MQSFAFPLRGVMIECARRLLADFALVALLAVAAVFLIASSGRASAAAWYYSGDPEYFESRLVRIARLGSGDYGGSSYCYGPRATIYASTFGYGVSSNYGGSCSSSAYGTFPYGSSYGSSYGSGSGYGTQVLVFEPSRPSDAPSECGPAFGSFSQSSTVSLDRSLEIGGQWTWELRLRFPGYGGPGPGYGLGYGIGGLRDHGIPPSSEARIFSEQAMPSAELGQTLGLVRVGYGDPLLRVRPALGAAIHDIEVDALLDTRWHHLAIVQSANWLRVFLDGQLVHEAASPEVNVPQCGLRAFGSMRDPSVPWSPWQWWSTAGVVDSAIFDLDWVRVSRDALYDPQGFEPPREADLQPAPSTALLMRFDAPPLQRAVLEEGPDGVVGFWGADWSGTRTAPTFVQVSADDEDADGVPLALDGCPDLPGNAVNADCYGCPLNSCGECGDDGLGDHDGDQLQDCFDPDDDNDGVPDGSDLFPRDAGDWADWDRDGIGDNADADDDGDGEPDASDAFPLDASESRDTDGDGTGDNADGDDDNDGFPDWDDAFPLVATEWRDFDDDGVGDNADQDDDNDGVADASDTFPNDASESRDSDGDGVGDNADGDDDNDGVPDGADNCATVANADQADVDGDHIGDACDADNDNDGVPDTVDNCRLIANPGQQDCDGDGVGDVCELAGSQSPYPGAVRWEVSSGGNGHWYARIDSNLTWQQARAACESLGGHLATIGSLAESDFAGVLDGGRGSWLGGFQPSNSCEPGCDWRWVTGEPWSFVRWGGSEPNDSGGEDALQFCCGGSGWNDLSENALNSAICEWDSGGETDCNHNGIPDSCDGDCNGDGIGDACDPGVQPIARSTPHLPFPCCGWNPEITHQIDVSGWPRAGGLVQARLNLCAYLHVEANQLATISIDGVTVWSGRLQGWACGWQSAIDFTIPGPVFNSALADGNANVLVSLGQIYNYGSCCNEFRLDFNYSTVPFDCNGNGLPDSCDIASGVDGDCNGDGVPNACEIAYLGALDCNRNGVPDACDIGSGHSTDLNLNSVPDDCEADCNRNARPDDYDLGMGASVDCNHDAIPDECQDGSVAQWTGNMGALGKNVTATGVLRGMPITASPVLVTVRARGDLNGTTEFITLNMAGRKISNLFVAGGSDCPATYDTETLTIPAATWNEMLLASPGGNVAVTVTASPLVDPNQCPSPMIDVRVDYKSPRWDCDLDGASDFCRIAAGAVPDCNGNIVPDSCDIAIGFSRDCDANGVPDDCDIAAGALDEDANGMPDSCQIAYGDFDLDGEVTTADVGYLLLVFGDLNSAFGDLDQDGVVTTADVSLLLMNFGPVPR